MKSMILFICVAAASTSLTLSAGIPEAISYQGRLIDALGDPVVDGAYSITFTIHDAPTAGNSKWTETQSSVTVINGLFNVELGSVTPLDDSVFSIPERYLGIQIGADPEILPRTRLLAVPYSYHSLSADTADYATSSGAADDGDWTVVGDTVFRSTGRVGIGTSSPQAKMDIVMTEFENDVLRVKAATSAETRLKVEDNAGGYGWVSKAEYDLAGLTLTNKDVGNVLNLVSTEADINLRVHPASGATWEDASLTKLHINGSTGYVGIGTSSPAARLHVNETYSGGKYIAHFNKYGTGPGYIGFNRGTTGGRSYFQFDEANFGIYTSNSTESSWYHLSISGNTGVLSTNASFGIGTTLPAKRLQVDAVASDAALRLHAPAGDNNSPTPYLLFTGGYKTNNGAAIRGKNDALYGQTALSFYAGWNTGTYGDDPAIGDLYERMRIASNGNVGIGTTNPTQKLHVAGAVTATTYYGDGSNLTGISGTSDNDWTISGSTVYHLTGNVGIGTTNPTERLHVVGAVKVAGPGGAVNAITANTNGSFAAVAGINTGTGSGIYAESNSITNKIGAVRGKALQDGGVGIYGETNSTGVTGGSSIGVFGEATSTGVSTGGAAFGVFGRCSVAKTPGSVPSLPGGGYFEGLTKTALNKSDECTGVFGETWSTALGSAGVKGTLKETDAMGRAIWGEASPNGTGWAGYFSGNVHVTGTISKGAGSFKIDHPLDPVNKYLQHSFVESPDMMNVYNGNISTDAEGDAEVVLPNYFDALNKDFRYQLTVIGQFAQAIVSQKISDNSFFIKTDKPYVEVSWQITGIRKDPYAEANRIPVEEDKPDYEIGSYLHPVAYGISID